MDKRKIIIHNPCNEKTKNYRNYNQFWDDLTLELQKKYDVIENRYYEFAHINRLEVDLIKQTSPKGDFILYECEYVIEFEDTGDLYVLSVCDDLSNATLNEQSNPHLKKVLISQFIQDKIDHHTKENSQKYFPWIYFPSTIDDMSIFYDIRQNSNSFIDKMYFRGSGIEDRPIVTYINSDYLEGYYPIGGTLTYFKDLIKYKIGLSIGGRGELCYRDIEYMAMGIPFIRFEYETILNPPLIPNYHYISIERPKNMTLDRLGTIEHAKLIENKFLQIKDDYNFLNYISNNAKTYYERYLKRYNNVNHTLQLLGI